MSESIIESSKCFRRHHVTNWFGFPAQPLFYLLDGVALNYLDKPDDAIERLESGMTYLLDEIQLERDIYQQLAISYDKKGNATQAVKMRSKAQELSKKL